MGEVRKLPTQGFWALANGIVPLAYVVVALHAIDFNTETTYLLSTDLLTGQHLPKDFLSQAVYGIMLWLTLGIFCLFIDSFRLSGITRPQNIPRLFVAQLFSKNGCIAVGMIAYLWLWRDGFLTSFAQYSPYLPNLFVLLNIIGVLLLLKLPTALLLTTSDNGANDFMHAAKKALPKLRSITFLALNPDTFLQKLVLLMENLRTFRFIDWETRVQQMMDIVPLIIIDGRFASDVVGRELTWILASPSRIEKTILITTETGAINLPLPMNCSLVGITICKLQDLKAVVWGK